VVRFIGLLMVADEDDILERTPVPALRRYLRQAVTAKLDRELS